MDLTFVNLTEKPELTAAMWAVHGAWPEFMLHDPLADRYCPRLAATFPSTTAGTAGRATLLAGAMDEIFGTHCVASVMNRWSGGSRHFGAIQARHRAGSISQPRGCQRILATVYLWTGNGGRRL